MQIETVEFKANRDLIRVYEIYHKDDPDKKVRYRTLRTLTKKQVKEKIVRTGLFPAEVFSQLRVERISE